MKTLTSIKTLDIQARTWFDKVNGNSYFAALVTINFGMPDEKTIKVPYQYGYGSQFETETLHQLQTDGLLPAGTIYNLSQWCADNNIILRSSNQKDCKKSQVKALIS